MTWMWKKDEKLRFVDLCIFIDKHITEILVPGENPDLEDTIYNYLWLLVKALAIKKCMFQKFDDYDAYSFYAAKRLYFALIKNQLNQGKTIKGKLIRPVKSCLNYTKALMYPMRIEYQQEAYREIFDEEYMSKSFDIEKFNNQLKIAIRSDAGETEAFLSNLSDAFQFLPKMIDEVLQQAPFKPTSVEYKRLKISLLLNCLNNLKVKKKLMPLPAALVLWKLPKSISAYFRPLYFELCVKIKDEIRDCYKAAAMDESLVDGIVHYKEGLDYEFDGQD